jgi:hypothetical protein
VAKDRRQQEDHRSPVEAMVAGALPDGTLVIISGGRDGTVWVWRTTDGTRSCPRWTYPNLYGLSPFTAMSSSPRPG